MKATIRIETVYGFCHNWILHIVFSDDMWRNYFLGQDVKFCSRVLGVEPKYIAQQIGSNDLRQEETKEKLANFIIKSLELDEEKLRNIEPWELCCQ